MADAPQSTATTQDQQGLFDIFFDENGNFSTGIGEFLVKIPELVVALSFLIPGLNQFAPFRFLLSQGGAGIDQKIFDQFRQDVLDNRADALAVVEGLSTQLLPQIRELNELTSGRLQEAFDREGGFAARFAREVRQPVATGFENLRGDTLRQLEGLGEQGRKDLQRVFANALTQSETDLTQRGLNQTSNNAALRQANAARRADALNAFNEQIRREQIGITTKIGLQGLEQDSALALTGFTAEEAARLGLISDQDALKRFELEAQERFELEKLDVFASTQFQAPASTGQNAVQGLTAP